MSTPVLTPPNGRHARPPRRRPLKGRIISVIVTLALVTIAAGYLAGPAAWQWAAATDHQDHLPTNPEGTLHQISTVLAPASDTSLLAKLKAAPTSPQGSPIILTYHDIGYNASEYTVTPEAFAAQMQLLAEAGWHTTTAAELSDWLKGKPLPPHSVQITFDDGPRGVWQYADPILARNNQHAVAYIITGFVGTHLPYYMTWRELTALQASGRWDLEAHTHLGHLQVPTDAAGHNGPFLTNLQYLPAQKRVETVDEFRTRVRNDLEESKKQLVAHGFPEPAFFAYPFSAHADVPAANGALAEIVESLFQAAMLDQPGSVAITAPADLAAGNLARMDTTADVSPATFVAKIVEASPLDPATAAPFSRPADWTLPDETPLTLPVDEKRGTRLDPGAGAFTSRAFAPLQSKLWRSYTVAAELGDFQQIWDGTTTGITVLSGDPQQVEVSVSTNSYRIYQGKEAAGGHELGGGELTVAPTHKVSVTVDPAHVVVTIDGREITDSPLTPSARNHGPAGGIEIDGYRRDAASPIPRIASLTVK